MIGVSLQAAPTCAHSSGGGVAGSMSRSSSTSSNSPGAERGRNDGPIAWRDDKLATASGCATRLRGEGWRETIAARPTERRPLDGTPATGLFYHMGERTGRRDCESEGARITRITQAA